MCPCFPFKESLGAGREQSKNSHSSSSFSVSEERGDGEGVVSHELSLLSDTRRCIRLTDLTIYLGLGFVVMIVIIHVVLGGSRRDGRTVSTVYFIDRQVDKVVICVKPNKRITHPVAQRVTQ
jgi:hypothetical protein